MTEEQNKPFNMAAVFQNREKIYEENPHLTEPAVRLEPKKESPKNEQEMQQNADQNPKEVKAADGAPKKPEKDYKKELEKAEKRIEDNRKWGEKNARRIAAFQKNTKMLLENGVLSEEDAEQLNSHIPDDLNPPQASKGFFPRLGELIDEELTHMKRYVDAPDVDEHIAAFNHFMALGELSMPGSQRDHYEEILEELQELEQTGEKVSLFKRILSIGEDYYKDGFKEIRDGGIQAIKRRWEEREEEHKKDVDKLTKEIDKLKRMTEDYTERPTRLSSSGGFARKNENTGPSESLNLNHLFKNREAYIASYRGK